MLYDQKQVIPQIFCAGDTDIGIVRRREGRSAGGSIPPAISEIDKKGKIRERVAVVPPNTYKIRKYEIKPVKRSEFHWYDWFRLCGLFSSHKTVDLMSGMY